MHYQTKISQRRNGILNQLVSFKSANTKNADDSYISEEEDIFSEVHEVNLETEVKIHSCFIRITRPFRTRWDLFTMLLALYNCFTVPFMVAFYNEESVGFFVANTLIDIVFMVDIVFNFFTTFIDQNGDEILDERRIVKHYLKGDFWIDFIASFPIDNFLIMFSNLSEGSEIIQFSDLLKLVRILRLGRIIRFTRTRDDIKATMKLMELTLYLIMWVHLTGCVWFIVVKQEEEWIPVPDFLTGTTSLYETDIWMQYFTSFYHAVWLLTGGEVAPRNALQAFLASTLIIIGALITAVLFGEMAVLMSTLSRRETEFEEILDGALTTMNNMKLPEDLTNRILDYITSTQSSLSAQEEYETFEKFISPSLSQEVSACIYDPIISRNSILASEERLTESLMHKLHNLFTKPEVEIIIEGTESNSLYFLVNGECQVFVTDRYKSKKFHTNLSEGEHFGEIGLVYDTSRTASVVGTGYCTIAELYKKDYEGLVATFPHLVEKFKASSDFYNDPWKEFLLESLNQAYYFDFLPSTVCSELVYIMDIIKIDKGEYLFKPGEKATQIYIVADGELELSWTVNEMDLFLLKKELNIQNMEKAPKVPKKQANLSDFKKYEVDWNRLEGVKKKAELVPLMNESEIVGSVSLEEEVPELGQLIGDYPQELVIQILKQGTLINSKLALVKHTYSLQCKALKNCTIYALKIETIKNLCRDHSEFKAEINKIVEEMESDTHFLAMDYLDYHLLDSCEKQSTRRWKSIIVKLNSNMRVARMKGTSEIALMVAKLQAIFACERAENFTLAEKVQRGEIPPHYIEEDGTLDPAAENSDSNSQLPRSHPIMKAFRNIFKEITHPDGSIVKEYNSLEKTILAQTKELEEFEAQIADLKEKIGEMGREGRLPDIRREPNLKLDIRKVNESAERHRKKREAELEKKRKLSEEEPRIISRSGSREPQKKKPTDLLSFIKK